MRNARLTLLGAALIALFSAWGCTTGLEGGGGGDTPGAMVFKSSYPSDGATGIPLNVGIAAMVFPDGYEMTDVSPYLKLYDTGPAASVGALPDVVADGLKNPKASGTEVTGLAPFFRESCSLLCNGVTTEYLNVAGLALATTPGFDPCAGTWDYCRDPGAVTTIDLDDGSVYALELQAPAGGLSAYDADAEEEVVLDAGETLSVSFETPPLWRYYGSVQVEVLTKPAALPGGSFAAAGFMDGADPQYSFVRIFDNWGRMTDEDAIENGTGGIPGSAEMRTIGARYFANPSTGVEYLYLALRYGDDLMGGRHGVFVARYELENDGNGYTLGSRIEYNYEDEVDEITFMSDLETYPIGMALDGLGRLYLSGRYTEDGAPDNYYPHIIRFTPLGDTFLMSTESVVTGDPTSGVNQFRAIAIDSSNDLLLTSIESSAPGVYDIVLSRYTTGLERKAWHFVADPAFYTDAALSGDGGVLYLSGSSLDPFLIPPGDSDAVLQSYDAAPLKAGTGKIESELLIDEAVFDLAGGDDYFYGVAVGPDGSVYAVGKGLTAGLIDTAITLKYDSALTTPALGERADSCGSVVVDYNTRGYGIAADGDGTIFAAGFAVAVGNGVAAGWKLDRNLNCSYVQPSP